MTDPLDTSRDRGDIDRGPSLSQSIGPPNPPNSRKLTPLGPIAAAARTSSSSISEPPRGSTSAIRKVRGAVSLARPLTRSDSVNSSSESFGENFGAGVGSGQNSSESANDQNPLLNSDRTSVESLIESGKSVIAANPQNEEVKNLIFELELYTMKAALENLKSKKDIKKEDYDKFMKDIQNRGLTLKNKGPDEIEKSGGLLNFGKKTLVANSLEAILKDAEVEIDAAKQKQIRDALMGRNNIGEKVALRDYVISRTGRENGPDIALKVIPRITDTEFESIKNIIHENSSITEVMNILAFLLNNKTDRGTSIVTEFSIEYGEHDKNGKYTDASKIGKNDGGDINTVYSSLNNGPEPYNIKTLTQNIPSSSTVSELPAGGIILPEGIIKRDASSYDTQDPITITYDKVPLVISACTLQMINLLENTRQVFGGWAKLFKGMQGGSTKSKTKTKKTRRRYRRKY